MWQSDAVAPGTIAEAATWTRFAHRLEYANATNIPGRFGKLWTMKTLLALSRLIDTVNERCARIATWLVLAACLISCGNAFARYLFGMSSMRLWLFALVSTLGRVPGTWVLSTQGAHAASGHYHYVLLVAAVVAMAALPLYYYRTRLLACVLRPSRPPVWAAKSNLVVR